MQKENHSIQKIELRKKFTQLRRSISKERREKAAIAIQALALSKGMILSFYSFGSEIDLSLLNALLIQEKRLVLPRIENNRLVPYQVFDLQQSLQKSSFGGFEPHPQFSSQISLSKIHLILVPGLAFDSEKFRLGYGKGHYDQFLKTTGNIKTAGIGFKEQLIQSLLPRDPWDIPLKTLSLF